MTVTVESARSAAATAIGTRKGSGAGPDPEIGGATYAPKTGTGTERNQSQKTALAAVAASENGIAERLQGWGPLRGGAVEAGRGVETGNGGAGAEIASESGSEAKGWMERRPVRETAFQNLVSAFQRSRKEKWLKEERNEGTGSETGTGGAATGTGTGVGGSGTETGSTREIVETETEGSGERSGMLLHGRRWLLKETAPTRRMEAQHTWRSTARRP